MKAVIVVVRNGKSMINEDFFDSVAPPSGPFAYWTFFKENERLFIHQSAVEQVNLRDGETNGKEDSETKGKEEG